LNHDEAGAPVFLDQGWTNEAQFGFLLVRGTIPDSALLAILFCRSTWQEFTFAPVVQALIAPPTDGDGVFIAARTEGAITHIEAPLTEHLTIAGFAVGPKI
jgi:hypothetical protein